MQFCWDWWRIKCQWLLPDCVACLHREGEPFALLVLLRRQGQPAAAAAAAAANYLQVPSQQKRPLQRPKSHFLWSRTWCQSCTSPEPLTRPLGEASRAFHTVSEHPLLLPSSSLTTVIWQRRATDQTDGQDKDGDECGWIRWWWAKSYELDSFFLIMVLLLPAGHTLGQHTLHCSPTGVSVSYLCFVSKTAI